MKVARWRDWLALAAFVAFCFTVAGIGGAWTSTSLESWYASLRKPAWTPPEAVFGPVWSALYLAMAVAAWLVWRRAGFRGAARPLALFAAQLALNLAWTWIFFGLRRPGAAFGEVALLWAAILATVLTFRRVSSPAAWLLVPYLLWVSYAAALNFAIWRLNA
ncbi:MAG: tryptophan-rich sensory protein [Armatimonadetes bacterium]|nr:tryptophan-rich sensory protein [Armatimonadota bacterium]